MKGGDECLEWAVTSPAYTGRAFIQPSCQSKCRLFNVSAKMCLNFAFLSVAALFLQAAFLNCILSLPSACPLVGFCLKVSLRGLRKHHVLPQNYVQRSCLQRSAGKCLVKKFPVVSHWQMMKTQSWAAVSLTPSPPSPDKESCLA